MLDDTLVLFTTEFGRTPKINKDNGRDHWPRVSCCLLAGGGTASGPVSFMRGADASAGTIKSGGATRRAAKMVVLDVDHPDIVEFVETKMNEEHKIRALRDAGFDMDLGGKDITSVQYQNANNSVRVTDEFMRAVEEGKEFGLRGRLDGHLELRVSRAVHVAVEKLQHLGVKITRFLAFHVHVSCESAHARSCRRALRR